MLTGLYPPTHRTETRRDTLPRGIELLSERFDAAGFQTACVTSMGNVSTATGFDRGFDDFFEVYKDETVIERRRRTTASNEKLYHDGQELLAYPRAEDLSEVLFDWWASHEESDTFVLVWAIDPHMPYDPPAEADWFLDDDYDGDPSLGRKPDTLKNASDERDFQRLRDLYDCCIRYMDEQFGEICAWLREHERYEDSAICFVGDHGESFGERTLIRNPIRGHSSAPYDEQIHVPFILKTPDGDSDEREELYSLIDIAPTVLDAAGVDSFESAIQGVSALDTDTGRNSVFTRTKVTESAEVYYGLRTDTDKYIQIEPPKLSVNGLWNEFRSQIGIRLLAEREQLYNLTDDETELQNLRSQATERCRQFESDLEEWLQTCLRIEADETGTLTDAVTIEQLKSLGYK